GSPVFIYTDFYRTGNRLSTVAALRNSFSAPDRSVTTYARAARRGIARAAADGGGTTAVEQRAATGNLAFATRGCPPALCTFAAQGTAGPVGAGCIKSRP